MGVHVEIVKGPLKPVKVSAGRGTGAFVLFEGIVRGEENGKKIIGLDYQVYEPMASKQLDLLAREMIEKHGVIEVAVWHSAGKVRVGRVSFRLLVESGHRKEALAAMDEFIDRMKKDVPIWKKPVASPAGPRRRVHTGATR